jgi:hypothetical protein
MKNLILILLVIVLAAVFVSPASAALPPSSYTVTTRDVWMVAQLYNVAVFIPAGSEIYRNQCVAGYCYIQYGLWVQPPAYSGWIPVDAINNLPPGR